MTVNGTVHRRDTAEQQTLRHTDALNASGNNMHRRHGTILTHNKSRYDVVLQLTYTCILYPSHVKTTPSSQSRVNHQKTRGDQIRPRTSRQPRIQHELQVRKGTPRLLIRRHRGPRLPEGGEGRNTKNSDGNPTSSGSGCRAGQQTLPGARWTKVSLAVGVISPNFSCLVGE